MLLSLSSLYVPFDSAQGALGYVMLNLFQHPDTPYKVAQLNTASLIISGEENVQMLKQVQHDVSRAPSLSGIAAVNRPVEGPSVSNPNTTTIFFSQPPIPLSIPLPLYEST